LPPSDFAFFAVPSQSWTVMYASQFGGAPPISGVSAMSPPTLSLPSFSIVYCIAPIVCVSSPHPNRPE
jgi:hypothetical protein